MKININKKIVLVLIFLVIIPFVKSQTITGTYIGCYTDNSNRALPNSMSSSQETIESCEQKTSDAGYKYAGLQWKGECWAGNDLRYDKVDDSECNTPCTLDGSKMCGGSWRNSIYQVTPKCTSNDWSCTWNACQSNNQQTGTCTKKINCLTDTGKPAETQICTYTAPASTSSTATLKLEFFKVTSAGIRTKDTQNSKICQVSNTNLECRSDTPWETITANPNIGDFFEIKASLNDYVSFGIDKIFIGTTSNLIKQCAPQNALSDFCATTAFLPETHPINTGSVIIKLISKTPTSSTTTTTTSTTSTSTTTIPSTTQSAPASNTADVDLNGDNVPDLRIKLNSISSNSCKASFTYLVNDLGTGLCNSNECSAQSTDPNSICNKGFGYCTIGTTCNYYQPNKKYPNSACCPDGFKWDSADQKCKDTQGSGRCSTFGEFDANAETTCCQASSTTGFWFPIRRF